MLIDLTPHYGKLFIGIAVAICLLTGWSFTLMLEDMKGRQRFERVDRRDVSLALCAGLGVWSAHFSATMAYRPDLQLGYAMGATALSALLGIVMIGMPMAALPRFRVGRGRVTLGFVAGGGIWCMHAVGISALTHCQHDFSRFSNWLGALGGAIILAIWQSRNTWRWPLVTGSLFFSAAVCFIHFVSLIDDIVTSSQLPDTFGAMLSPNLLLACVISATSVCCLIAFMAAARVRMQRDQETKALRAVIESISDGLVVITRDGRLKHCNDRFFELFDTPETALHAGMSVTDFVSVIAHHGKWSAETRVLVDRALPELIGSTTTVSRDCRLEDGRLYQMRCSPVIDRGIVITFHDVTSEREAINKLRYQASHDPLTGLGNRPALHERKLQMISDGMQVCLLLIDLDDFKQVNDTFGHGVGDKLLVHAARQLEEITRERGFAARMGGDEMAVLVPGQPEEAVALATKIVEKLAEPVVIDGYRILSSCSIGFAQTDAELSAQDLMKRADLALYAAKRSGRNRMSVYEPGLAEALMERQFIIEGLREALRNGGFCLAFQPVNDLSSNLLTGYEALIRWKHDERGWIGPDKFIPIAEECGLIEEIGRWVIAEACRWLATQPPHLYVAINVSPEQLLSDLLLPHLAQTVLINNLAPHRVELEITETALMRDPLKIGQCLERLRDCGFKIALDDFGTGQSSLAHLRDFHFDRLKIDRSFVVRSATEPRCMAVLRATAAIGRELGVITHAEGVETKEQVDLLRSIGCDAIQGYFIGRPEIAQSTTIYHKVADAKELRKVASADR